MRRARQPSTSRDARDHSLDVTTAADIWPPGSPTRSGVGDALGVAAVDNQAPPRGRHRRSTMLPLTTAIMHALAGGTGLCLAVAVVQLVLLFVGYVDGDGNVVAFNVGFLVFNLLAQCWTSFAFYYVLSVCAVASYVQMLSLVASTLSVLLGVWGFFYFEETQLSRSGLLAVYLLQALQFFSLGSAPAGPGRNALFGLSKPITAESLALFASVVRLSIIVVVPLVARLLSNNHNSIAAFFAAECFVATLSAFAAQMRASLNLSQKQQTVLGVLSRIGFRDFTVGFGHLVGNLLCFFVFYIIALSRWDLTDEVLFSVFIFHIFFFSIGIVTAFATFTQWRVLTAASSVSRDRLAMTTPPASPNIGTAVELELDSRRPSEASSAVS